MLFDTALAQDAETATARDEAEMGVAFAFDWQAGCYLMEAGSPVEVTGNKAVQEWMQQVLRTKRERYAIYPTDFGAPAQDLIGQKYPKGFLLSELRRQLTESGAYCPAIETVSQLASERDQITGTVTLRTPAGERQEVFYYGP